jgi:hypothetical protein
MATLASPFFDLRSRSASSCSSRIIFGGRRTVKDSNGWLVINPRIHHGGEMSTARVDTGVVGLRDAYS